MTKFSCVSPTCPAPRRLRRSTCRGGIVASRWKQSVAAAFHP
jgi:hypothetical protein